MGLDGDDELVGAEAGDHLTGPAQPLDAVGDRLEHGVTDGFAVQLVHRPEVDEVDEQESEAVAVLDELLGGDHEPVAVEQTRALIVGCEERHSRPGVGERRCRLARDDERPDRLVVEEVRHRELADEAPAGAGREVGVERHRVAGGERSDRLEDGRPVGGRHVTEERPSDHPIGGEAEGSGHRRVGQPDRAVAVDEHHHRVHLLDDRTHQRRVAGFGDVRRAGRNTARPAGGSHTVLRAVVVATARDVMVLMLHETPVW